MTLTRRHVLAGSVSLTALGTIRVRPSRADGHIRTWRQYATGGWGQVHFRMAEPASGPGNKTPLVCLHQSPTSSVYYKEFQAVMAEDRLVLAPDTPGYGSSTAPSSQPDMEDYGTALVESLTDLGYGPGGNGAVDLMGFHTGNFVGMEIARQAPNLVRKMVMPGIPYYIADEREARRELFGQPRPYFTDPDYMRRSYTQSVYDRDGPLSKDRYLELFVSRLRAGTKSHFGFNAVFRYNPDPVLKAIPHPVLLPILNETLAEPTRQAGTMIENVTVVEMMELDSTTAWFTAPERLATVMRSFLDDA